MIARNNSLVSNSFWIDLGDQIARLALALIQPDSLRRQLDADRVVSLLLHQLDLPEPTPDRTAIEATIGGRNAGNDRRRGGGQPSPATEHVRLVLRTDRIHIRITSIKGRSRQLLLLLLVMMVRQANATAQRRIARIIDLILCVPAITIIP